MITCPVCEHQQAAGSECEVCGRRLEAGHGTDAPVSRLDGLEPTALEVGEGPGLEAVPGLEPTRFEASADAVPEPVPELEATRVAAVEVVAELLADLEPTLAEVIGDGPTPEPAVVTCRYCRSEAAPGERRCGRCGMRLPAPATARPAPAERAPTLCGCGTPVTRSTCPTCGARNAVPPDAR